VSLGAPTWAIEKKKHCISSSQKLGDKESFSPREDANKGIKENM
jgi:hypothetical protein